MSRFSYSLDIGEELEREKEVKRRIAISRGKRDDDEDSVRLDPKFEQEIQQLADETRVTVDDDDSIVIKPAKHEPMRDASVKEAKAKPERKAELKAPKVEKQRAEDRPESKKGGAEAKHIELKEAPKPEPKPLHTEPRTPGGGSGRLILALLLVCVIAVILIYSGLASKEQKPLSPSEQYAGDNNVSIVRLADLGGAKAYWFTRALEDDNYGEASALLKMVACDSDKEVTEQSNPLDYTSCDVSGKVIEVTEGDLRNAINLSKASKCDALGEIIMCDNGYLIDGLVASKGDKEPAHLVAKSGGEYTVVDFNAAVDESVVVISDTKDNFLSYTVPSDQITSMALKLFVGGNFPSFNRVFLDHVSGSDRVVLYKLT